MSFKKFLSQRFSLAIAVGLFFASLAILWWVLGSPGITTIGENVSVGGQLTVSGNVGIGTSSPGQKIHIYGPSGSQRIKIESAGTTSSDQASLQLVAGNNSWISWVSGDSDQLRFFSSTLNSNVMTLTSSGNVGIGTTSPGAKLDIPVDLSTPAFRLGPGGDSGRIWAEYKNGGPAIIMYDYDDIGGGIYFRESPTTNNETNPEYEAFIVGRRGNVGIGTTAPNYKLEVQGSASIGNFNVSVQDFRLQRQGSAHKVVRHWYTSSNESPWYTYGENLIWTGERAGMVLDTTAARPYYEAYSPLSGYKEFGFVNVTSGSFTNTNLIPSLVLKNNGNVGIGTTSPAYKLDIAGALRLQPSSAPTGANGVIYYDSTENKFKCYQNGTWVDCIGAGGGGGYWAASGTNIYNTNTGNVGIGTTSPAYKLDVSGDLRVTGQAYLGIQRVSNYCGFSYSCRVTCPSGTRVLGGGCYGSYTNYYRAPVQNYPDSDTSWYCYNGEYANNWTAYAICARIQP
jgi:hypothetical protein